ncbi:hypothetical protein [Mesobacillus thioparans]|uniref:hypothetical protein n=1 Tax=Mesobacillus thioparans TaxID=370439 RepID=UPI0039EE32EF
MANSKQYEIAFRLGAKVHSSMGNSFNQANKNLNNVNKKLKDTQNQSKVASNAMNKVSGALKTAAAAAAAFVGIAAIKSFTNESVQLAKAQIEVETKLGAVLQNVKSIQKQGPEAYKKVKAELLGVASELQGVGVIGDEVTIAGMQQLATFQMSGKAIKTLSGGMLDLLAQQKGLNASQQDAVGLGNMIGKVMGGQVGALSRVGISFTKAQEKALKTGNEIERATVLAQVLKDNVGGVNAALAKTDQGKIQQAANAYGDMKEEIGKKILPLQAKFANWFFTKIPKIQNTLLTTVDKVTGGFAYLSRIINYAKPHVISLANSIRTNVGPVIDAIQEKASWLGSMGLIAFNNIKQAVESNLPGLQTARDTISSIGTKLKDGVKAGFELAQPYIEWAATTGLPAFAGGLTDVLVGVTDTYNFISANWPLIEPIIAGVAAGFLVYKSYVLATTLITKGAAAATWIATAATTAWGAAISFVTSPIGIVVLAIGLLIAAGVALYKNWDTVKEGIIFIWNAILAGVRGPANLIIGIANGIISAYEKMINAVAGAVNNMPSVTIPDWVPGVGGKSFGIPKIPQVSLPRVPMLASGGVTTGPTLAMIGEGAEQEAVMPLSKLNNLLTATKEKGEKVLEKAASIVFGPTIIIQGDADEQTVHNAMGLSYKEFKRFMDKYNDDKTRHAF